MTTGRGPGSASTAARAISRSGTRLARSVLPAATGSSARSTIMKKKGSWLDVLKHTWSDFGADRCSDLAAALSYYTIFSIPPLGMLALLVLGMFVSPATVQGIIQGQAG